MNKNFGSLSLNPKLVGQLVKGEVTLVDSSGTEIAGSNAMEVTLVDSSGTELTSFEINNTGAASVYIGKPSNGDFVTAYASATTIDFTVLPSDIDDITSTDIEIVRQIATDGSVTRTYTRDDVLMSAAANTLTVAGASFLSTDDFVVYTNIPRPSGGGGASADANYKIASWEGTATYASTTTITIAGAYPTINNNSQVVYIKFTDDTLHTSETFVNAQNGVTIEHAAGTLTIYGAGTPFAATNDYEVGINATPVGLNISGDALKTEAQVTNFGHYTDVEHIVEESNIGFTGTATGTDINTLADSGAAFSNEDIAVGYEAYSEEEDVAATVLSVDSSTSISTDNITTDWTGDTYWLPECKRYVITMDSYNFFTIHVRLSTGDANNVAYCKIYGTLDVDADTTADDYWVDLSSEIFGAAQLSATNGSTEGIYFVDNATPILKYMIKIVGEVMDGGAAASKDQAFDIYIRKSS
jgi:hypothetical protein